MPFKVIVADNFHYMDESKNYELGTFDTLDEAISASRRIVDQCLESAYKQGIPALELFKGYLMFGEDPYIVSSEVEGILFSARDYARQKCEELDLSDSKTK